jgi:hypothetical protein
MFQKMGFWGVLSLIFFGFIVLAVLTHAQGFASSAGTLFTGVNGIGSTLSGSGSASGHSGGQSRASRMAFAA